MVEEAMVVEEYVSEGAVVLVVSVFDSILG
jgi:hypothetical protein